MTKQNIPLLNPIEKRTLEQVLIYKLLPIKYLYLAIFHDKKYPATSFQYHTKKLFDQHFLEKTPIKDSKSNIDFLAITLGEIGIKYYAKKIKKRPSAIAPYFLIKDMKHKSCKKHILHDAVTSLFLFNLTKDNCSIQKKNNYTQDRYSLNSAGSQYNIANPTKLHNQKYNSKTTSSLIFKDKLLLSHCQQNPGILIPFIKNISTYHKGHGPYFDAVFLLESHLKTKMVFPFVIEVDRGTEFGNNLNKKLRNIINFFQNAGWHENGYSISPPLIIISSSPLRIRNLIKKISRIITLNLKNNVYNTEEISNLKQFNILFNTIPNLQNPLLQKYILFSPRFIMENKDYTINKTTISQFMA